MPEIPQFRRDLLDEAFNGNRRMVSAFEAFIAALTETVTEATSGSEASATLQSTAFLLLAANETLAGGRVLAGGEGIDLVDDGTTLTVSLDDIAAKVVGGHPVNFIVTGPTDLILPPSGTVATLADLTVAGGGFEPTIAAGTTAQYWRGDKTWQTLNAAAVADFSEAAQDAVGTILVDSATIDFTYSDGTPSITADVKATTLALTALTLETGWANFGGAYQTAAYSKTLDGFVQLAGLVTGAGGGGGAQILTLPAGARPAAQRFFVVLIGNAFGSVTVATSGDVTIAAGPTNTYVSLDQIGFFV